MWNRRKKTSQGKKSCLNNKTSSWQQTLRSNIHTHYSHSHSQLFVGLLTFKTDHLASRKKSSITLKEHEQEKHIDKMKKKRAKTHPNALFLSHSCGGKEIVSPCLRLQIHIQIHTALSCRSSMFSCPFFPSSFFTPLSSLLSSPLSF